MIRVLWSRQAVEDVEAIKFYISRDSVRYAQLVAERIVEAVDRLTIFPQSGRIVPEVGDETIREVIFGNYRIVYRISDVGIEILTVFHASRFFRLPG